MERKLCKSRYDVKLDGVCAGLANYLSIDVTLVRILWVLVTLFGGAGIIVYIACMLIMPRQPETVVENYDERHN